MSDEDKNPPLEKKKAGAPLGSTNAAKDVTAEAHLHIRCIKADKSEWVKAAEGRGGLSAWVIATLNEAANKFK